MFQIRAEQMEALMRIQEDRFIRELVEHAKTKCPEEAVLDYEEELPLIAQKAIAKGRQYGIEEEDHIRHLLEWMFKHDLDFDKKFEWAHAILTTPGIQSASARMLALANAMAALPADS